MNPKLKETDAQRIIHRLISDPSIIRTTQSGKRLQILSPGNINVHEGPDFSDIAVLLDGNVYVGDAEFHFKTSDWFNHGHDEDKNYSNVILEIAQENDSKRGLGHEVLLINSDDLIVQDTIAGLNTDMSSLEDLQHFSLIRLLRKTAEAKKLLLTTGFDAALTELTRSFIERYNRRRRRPVHTKDKLADIIFNSKESSAYKLLKNIEYRNDISILDYLQVALRDKKYVEGPHLRRELILNAVLPLAVSLADEKHRIELFLWYWSVPALNQYGILKREFPELPQNFLWQQQGMLEYMKDHGKRKNVCSELLIEYGFAEVLEFYKQARSPLEFGN